MVQFSGLGDVFAGSVCKSNHDTGFLKVRCWLQNGNGLTMCLHVQEGRPLKRGAHTLDTSETVFIHYLILVYVLLYTLDISKNSDYISLSHLKQHAL